MILTDTVLEPLMLPLPEPLTVAEAQEDTEPLMLPEDVDDTEVDAETGTDAEVAATTDEGESGE